MADAKVLGRQSLTAATPVDLYIPAAGVNTAFSVKFVNNTGGAALIKCSISSTTATIESEGRIIPDDLSLADGEAVSITGQTIDSGFFLVVESDTTGVTSIANGFED